jgi:hypothetical protein
LGATEGGDINPLTTGTQWGPGTCATNYSSQCNSKPQVSGPLVLEDGECDDVELADDGKELEDDEWVVPEHTNCIADGSTPNARE